MGLTSTAISYVWVGMGGSGGWVPMSYHLLPAPSPPEWLCIKADSCARHFNISFIVWAESQDGVHKPQFLERKKGQSGWNQGSSAYQPTTLPVGHTGLHGIFVFEQDFILFAVKLENSILVGLVFKFYWSSVQKFGSHIGNEDKSDINL